MKNLKKFLAVIITVAMLATMMIPAFAEEEISADAKTCANLGLLAGDGAGVTAEYLAKGTERIQAAIIMLRLLGKIDEAVEFDYTENFDDADKVWQGGKNIMGYLKANPEYGWVGDAGNFKPTDKASAKEIYKVILNVLGYEVGEDKDFVWNDTIEFAAEKGLKAIGDLESLTNDDVAAAIVEGLKANLKSGDKTLVEDLVAKKIVDEKVAQDEGLIAKEVTATVAPIAAKKLEVKFNRAIDTGKAEITVTKGVVSVNVEKIEFSEDKTSAVITTVTNLTKGEYTVTIAGLNEKAIKVSTAVEDVKVSQIKLVSDKAPMKGNAGTEDGKKALVNYEVLNQYGEKMTGIPVNWTASTGQALATTSDGKYELVIATNYFTPGQEIYLTGVHVQTGTVLNTKVSIVLPSSVDSVVFKGVYDVDKGEFTDLPAGFENGKYELLFETMDQYGNKVTPASGDIVFTSQNPLVAGATPVAARTVEDVEYQAVSLDRGTYFGNGGSVTIQAISIYTGKTAIYTIEVPAVAVVKTFTMSAPANLVAEGEKVEIPFTALDQFGNEITKFDTLQGFVADGTLRFIPADNIAFEKEKDGSAKLMYTAPKGVVVNKIDYPVYISSVVLGGNVTNLSFNVKEEAVATVVVGLEKVALNLVEGATTKIEDKNIKVQDQHGRTILWEDYEGAGTLSLSSSNSAAVGVTGDAANGFTLTAGTKGTATLTFKIDGEDASKYSFNVATVKANEVVSYEIADIPLVKAGASKQLEITGKLASGASVVLNTAAVVKQMVSADTSVVTAAYETVTLTAVGSIDASKDDATTTIVVTIEGPKDPIIITKNVVVSYKAPRAEKIEVDSDIFVADFNDSTLLAEFEVTDQYGDEITTNKGVIVKTNEVKEGNKTVGWTVTLVTSNGKTATTIARLSE